MSPQPLDTLLVCRSTAIEQLRALALRVAGGDSRVHIAGESGVGKDVLARFVHARSRRAGGPFVAVSAVGPDEAELAAALAGAFRDARGGTIFVDEVSELSLALQGRLLRLIEGPQADVRLITSTTRDLGELVAHGQFREDLMYRLTVVHLRIPPLRERADDVRPLAEWKASQLGKALTCSPEAWSALERYYWPGNVRELSNVVEQLVWTAPGAAVEFADLPESVRGYAAGGVRPVRERRRQVADEIYSGLVDGEYTFWQDVYEMFMRRDLTRDDLRGVVARGLAASRGNYRALLALFGMPASDYKRLLNFLAAHECALDFREFRAPRPETRELRGRQLPPGGAAGGGNL